MNLSEKLNLNYCNTDIITKEIERHNKSCAEYLTNYPGIELNIWQTENSPYYKCLADIKTKQDNGEIVSDADYTALPIGGNSGYWSAAYGYYTINFHYNFCHPEFVNKMALLYKFMDFIAVVDFIDCRESEIMNWLSTFKFFALEVVKQDPTQENTCKFIVDILTAVDKTKDNKIDSLLNIDRSIAPDVFDNAVKYFKLKENKINYIKELNKDKLSFKAAEVMNILGITRPTLCKYVKQGLIIIDSNINGKYSYNKESVYSLLEYNK